MKQSKKTFTFTWVKVRSLVIPSTCLMLYIVIIWPNSEKSTQIKSTDLTTLPTVTIRKVLPKEHKSLKIPPQSEKSPHTSRLISNSINDHKVKSTREIIESQGYGTFPEVDMTKANSHKTYVFKALQDPQNNPNVASIVGKRIKFDPQRYSNDPSHYLSRIEPGRAFAAAAPGPNVTPLARIGHASIQTQQNKSIILEAKGQPGMPVSFTVFDGGIFSNGLGFTSLKADDSGIARAQFTPTSGVINQVRIRASSPVNSGTLQWNIFVNLENKKENTTKEVK
jgi:hypothetical protein